MDLSRSDKSMRSPETSGFWQGLGRSPNVSPFLSQQGAHFADQIERTRADHIAFRPSQTVTASQYMEFILRALGYSSADNKDLSGTLTNALTNGVITEGELAALQGGTFLRADLAYVSYYALDAAVSGSRQTLGDTLMDKGVFTVREKQAADALVTSGRK